MQKVELVFFTQCLVFIHLSPELFQSSLLLINYSVRVCYNQFIDLQLVCSLIYKSRKLFSKLFQILDLSLQLFFFNHGLLAFDFHVEFGSLNFQDFFLELGIQTFSFFLLLVSVCVVLSHRVKLTIEIFKLTGLCYLFSLSSNSPFLTSFTSIFNLPELMFKCFILGCNILCYFFSFWFLLGNF